MREEATTRNSLANLAFSVCGLLGAITMWGYFVVANHRALMSSNFDLPNVNCRPVSAGSLRSAQDSNHVNLSPSENEEVRHLNFSKPLDRNGLLELRHSVYSVPCL